MSGMYILITVILFVIIFLGVSYKSDSFATTMSLVLISAFIALMWPIFMILCIIYTIWKYY